MEFCFYSANPDLTSCCSPEGLIALTDLALRLVNSSSFCVINFFLEKKPQDILYGIIHCTYLEKNFCEIAEIENRAWVVNVTYYKWRLLCVYNKLTGYKCKECHRFMGLMASSSETPITFLTFIHLSMFPRVNV